jgi:hypothetical protein
MDTVNSNKSYTLTADFTDENDEPVTPLSARYRIDDEASGTARRAWTPIPVAGPSADIVISRTENAMVNAASAEEIRVVTVDFTYSEDRGGPDEYRYALKNIKGYPKTP